MHRGAFSFKEACCDIGGIRNFIQDNGSRNKTFRGQVSVKRVFKVEPP